MGDHWRKCDDRTAKPLSTWSIAAFALIALLACLGALHHGAVYLITGHW